MKANENEGGEHREKIAMARQQEALNIGSCTLKVLIFS